MINLKNLCVLLMCTILSLQGWCNANCLTQKKGTFRKHQLKSEGEWATCTSWQEMENIAYQDPKFGWHLSQTNPLRKEMKNLGIYDMNSNIEKIEACARLIFSKVEWDNIWANYSKRSGKKVVASGTGSNAEINFIMISMLKDLNIKAVPVLMRLRDTGEYSQMNADKHYIPYFNTFVVAIKGDDGKLCYFDGSSQYGYLNTMHKKLIVRGHIMDINKSTGNYLVNLADVIDSHCKTSVEMMIDIDEKLCKGLLKANVKHKYSGQLALSQRNWYNSFKDSVAYINELKSEDEASVKKINEGDIENIHSTIVKYSNENMRTFSKSVVENFLYESNSFAIDTAKGTTQTLYLYPLNHILLSKDIYDEVFNSPMSINYTFMLHIPQGFKIVEMPQNTNFSTDDNIMSYNMVVNKANDCIILNIAMKTNSVYFGPMECKKLESMLEAYENSRKKQIILKREL